MFLGRYHHNIDNKGRLTVPARFREQLATEGAYITRGFDHNLMVLPVSAFDRIYERLNHMNVADPMARLLKRLIFGNAERVDPDRTGRILIPQYLREDTGLNSDAVVVGAGDYFEIWSPESWAGQIAQLQDDEANAHRFAVLDLSS